MNPTGTNITGVSKTGSVTTIPLITPVSLLGAYHSTCHLPFLMIPFSPPLSTTLNFFASKVERLYFFEKTTEKYKNFLFFGFSCQEIFLIDVYF